MNIRSIEKIEQDAKAAAIAGNDECHYAYGSDERRIWIDAYCEQAELMEESA